MNIQQILNLPQIEYNLTGAQITEILNTLLEQALQPIFLSTNLGRKCCAEVLTKFHDDYRRKLSVLDKDKVIDLLYNSILAKPKDSFDFYKQLKLERTISFKILQQLLDICIHYEEDEILYCKFHHDLTKYLLILNTNLNDLGLTYSIVKFYSNLYLTFKSQIMQKYYKLAYKEVNKRKRISGILIDGNDLFKSMVIAISTAIDKYSEEKGALTSFIQQWFQSYLVNPEGEYEYGQAYSVPRYEKIKLAKEGQSVNCSFSYNIDDIKETEDIVSEGLSVIDKVDSEKLIKLINSIPGTEVAAIVLGLR